MHLDIHQALVPLTSPMPLRLTDARGTHVRSLAGTLWVTVDGDDADHVLEFGESWVVDSDASVLISPLQGSATVGLSEQRQTLVPAQRSLRHKLGRLLHGMRRPGTASGGLPEPA